MADIVFNIALGRIVEFATRINANDPANSAFLVLLLATTGLESDATLKDKTTVSALVSGTTDESTNTGYARKTLTDASSITVTVDNGNDRVDVDFPDQTWTAVANDGTGAISKLVVAYDSDTTAGTDANVVPCTMHAFAVTADGSDITAQIAASGFFRAS